LWNIETVKFNLVVRQFPVRQFPVLSLLAVLFILPIMFTILVMFIF